MLECDCIRKYKMARLINTKRSLATICSRKISLGQKIFTALSSIFSIAVVHVTAEILFISLLAYTLPISGMTSLAGYCFLLSLSFTPIIFISCLLSSVGLYYFFKNKFIGNIFYPSVYTLNKVLDACCPNFLPVVKLAYDKIHESCYLQKLGGGFALNNASLIENNTWILNILQRVGLNRIIGAFNYLKIVVYGCFAVACATFLQVKSTGIDISRSPFVVLCRYGFEWVSIPIKAVLAYTFCSGFSVVVQLGLYGAVYLGKQYVMDALLNRWMPYAADNVGNIFSFDAGLNRSLESIRVSPPIKGKQDSWPRLWLEYCGCEFIDAPFSSNT